ncbi:MAG: ribonuclease R, partial [Bacilli bacterium]|nr:ribonuclease R [Bacilli bacterium]
AETEEILKELEIEGKAYNRNGQYRSFPDELGFVQGAISINENNEGFITSDLGIRHYIHPNDLKDALDGDIVVIKPTNKLYRGDVISRVDKIIKRKDGLVTCKVQLKKGKKVLVPCSRIIQPINLTGIDIEELEAGTSIVVRIGMPEKSYYNAEYIFTVEKEIANSSEKSSKVQLKMDDGDFESIDKVSIEEILTLLRKFLLDTQSKKYSYNELQRKISTIRDINEDDLKSALSILEEKGQIYIDKNGLYSEFPKELGLVQGTITVSKYDEGFITTEDGKRFKVEDKDMNNALDGDKVIIRPTKKVKNGHIIAKVEKVVQRKDGLVVVEVTKDELGNYYLRPFNAKLDYPIVINPGSMKPLVEGDRIIVKIDQLSSKNCFYADFVKNIGHKDDPDADLKIIAIENNIAIEFSDKAIQEAEALPTDVSYEEKQGRLDLTDKVIFSIDGEKTKDRDDAISIEINEKGNYIVGVHISDVSHYVHPGMQLWKEALSRATSVYMVDTVIPMIPHILSNGICSLNEGVDRLTFSCIMEVSPEGQIIKYDFVDSVINSRKAMTYEDVNRIFEEGTMVDGYEEFYDDLSLMCKLSAKLEKVKERRGYVNFGSNDLEIEMDENGNPLQFRQREQKTAEKLIENFMLLANECYANYMIIPSPLRVHECPTEEKVEEAFTLLDKSGIKVKAMHDITNGKVIQQILKQIENMDERSVAANIILRAMPRARYDVEKIGHFGLGLQNYGHFTSPIRRAADLRGHYNLRMQRDNRFNIKDYEEFLETMDSFCQHISKKERNADQAERDANEFEMIKYMSGHLGEKFNAHVTYVSSKVIFVKTEQGIDGRIYPTDIEGDKFDFSDQTLSFNGRKTKKKIKIGTNLVLTALDADRDFGSISFGIDAEDLVLIKGRKRGA